MLNHKTMEYRYLGNTGLKVSVLSFGNMINYKPENVALDDSIILKCLESGINFFDTAEMYGDGSL
jgi:aryl-alcohol dehydrogenase-like predicted oxidoreductase